MQNASRAVGTEAHHGHVECPWWKSVGGDLLSWNGHHDDSGGICIDASMHMLTMQSHKLYAV